MSEKRLKVFERDLPAEVPVMLSVCSACARTRGWFPAPAGPAGA